MKRAFLWVGFDFSLRVQILIKLSMLIWLRYNWGCFSDSTFDGKQLNAMEGETLASALIANGIHLAGRSFKYHRPRGILGSGAEEPNALMDISRDKIRTQPNVRATTQEVYDGLIAKTQNYYPSITFDIGGINNLMAPFFSAGF